MVNKFIFILSFKFYTCIKISSLTTLIILQDSVIVCMFTFNMKTYVLYTCMCCSLSIASHPCPGLMNSFSFRESVGHFVSSSFLKYGLDLLSPCPWLAGFSLLSTPGALPTLSACRHLLLALCTPRGSSYCEARCFVLLPSRPICL